jgi:hypothetical protein
VIYKLLRAIFWHYFSINKASPITKKTKYTFKPKKVNELSNPNSQNADQRKLINVQIQTVRVQPKKTQ